MKTRLRIEPAPLQQLAYECILCKQFIASDREMPLNMIVIEGYSLCPNCRQLVNREIENSYTYRAKWLRRVREITRKKGWGWEYVPGKGFQAKR